MDQMIFEKIPGFLHLLYLVHSAAPLNILENFLVIVELYQGPEDPPTLSLTIMDPQMDPKMYPVRQNLGDPW